MVKTRAVAVLTAAGLAAGLSAAAGPAVGATAARPHRPGPLVEKLATGLEGPYGLQWIGTKRFLVAENGAGRVSEVGRHGSRTVRIKGLDGVAGVAAGRRLYAVLGGGDETAPAPDGDFAATSVVRADRNGKHPKAIANLLDYELEHNPDGQAQFDSQHQPYDALSNPFSMNLSRYGLLVADGGGNDVLKVDPSTGKVSTFFVPPTVTDVPACLEPGAQSNPGTTGCDSVPTGLAVARGAVYVSTLGAEVPGAGRVYKLNPRTGRVLHTWKGLIAPTGLAVSRRGAVFVSEVQHGFPEGQPGPDFDPATVGRITRIGVGGRRTHVHVTMPTGLTWHSGHLYATAWSLAPLLGIPKAGQVVWVKQRAFH